MPEAGHKSAEGDNNCADQEINLVTGYRLIGQHSGKIEKAEVEQFVPLASDT